MNTRLFWKNCLPFLIVNVCAMMALSLFLLICGLAPVALVLILLVWLGLLVFGLAWAYITRKRRLDMLLETARELHARYLLAEVLPPTDRAEEAVYQELLRMANKSMLEEIETVKRERRAYRDYVEEWVHEIKTPLTALKLLVENAHTTERRQMLFELERACALAEQALYVARSECAEKDYVVREVHLADVVHEAITDNKYLLRQNNIAVEVSMENETVFSDDKWLRFILDQLIVNAVQYRSVAPKLCFSARCECGKVYLDLTDNELGIAPADLPRIFDKGFTGHNGRLHQNATGFGLYLCQRLAEKLGIGLHAFSAGENQGTTMTLSFHVNDYVQRFET